MWGKEGERVLQKARGSCAPYRIRNRTGSPIFIWSDTDGSSLVKDQAQMVQIANEETLDWRFDDWKTMREVLASASYTTTFTHLRAMHLASCTYRPTQHRNQVRG